MAKRKKENAIIIDEPVQALRSSVVNFGDVVIEIHYNKTSGDLSGIVTEDGKVKKFDTEVK